jgi:hypothetical protein
MRGVRFVIMYEVRLWVALFRWLFRRPPRVTPGTTTHAYAGGARLLFGAFIGGQTSVDVLLSRPVTVPVKKALGEPVTQIRFHADDPEALVEAAGAYLRAAAPKD